MPLYNVTANITGESAQVQQRDGRTEFDRGEAEEFQKSLRLSGFDRVDIIEAQGRPAGAITAPASTPDRFGIGHQPSTEAQQAVQAAVQARQQGIDITPRQAQELGEHGVQRLINIERAIQQMPQIASIRQPLQTQVFQQAKGDFGERTLNVTPSERSQMAQRQKEAEAIAQEAMQGSYAGEIIKGRYDQGVKVQRGYRDLPEEYQTPETLRSIAEVSAERQQYYKELQEASRRGQVTTIGVEGSFKQAREPYQDAIAMQALVQKSLNREMGLGSGDGTNIGTSSANNILAYVKSPGLESSKNLGLVQEKKVGEKGFFKEYGLKTGGLFLGLVKGTIKGTGKLLYAPNYPGFTKKPVIDIGQSKVLKVKGQLYKDPDVQTALTVASLGLASRVKLVGKGISLVFGGLAIKAGGEFLLKEPTTGKAAEATFYASPFVLSKLPRPKFEILSVEAKPASNLDIITGRAAKGKPAPKPEVSVKEVPGLRALTEIKPAVVRKERVTGLERVPSRINISSQETGLLATRPTAGAGAGLQRVPEKAPEALTEKGNIIFKELGIEEGGILKAEPKAKPKKVLRISLVPSEAKISSVFSKIQKDLTKAQKISATTKQPFIRGEQYFGFRRQAYGIKTTERITTPKTYIEKPSKITTSKYYTNAPEPSLAVAESLINPKGTTYRIVQTPEGTQYATIRLRGGKYYLRSLTQPSGKTITKLFKNDKVIKTLKGELQPTIKFTEPLEQLRAKTYVSAPELRFETQRAISTSKGVSLLKKPKYIPTGRATIRTGELLQTVTERPYTKTVTGKPVIDLDTGIIKPEFVNIEVVPTFYKYVDYLPKQKPIIVEKTEGALYVEQPTISRTYQTTKVRAPFELGFKKAPSRMQRFKEWYLNLVPKEKLSQPQFSFVRAEDFGYLRDVPKQAKIRLPITSELAAKYRQQARFGEEARQRQAGKRIVKIQRPKSFAQTDLRDLGVTIPEFETPPRGRILPVSFRQQLSQPKVQQEPLVRPNLRYNLRQNIQPKLLQNLRQSNIARNVQDQRLNQQLQPKSIQRQNQIQNLRQNQQQAQQQRQIQQQIQKALQGTGRGKGTPSPRIRIQRQPRPPRTPPPFWRDSRGKSAQPKQERGFDYFYREFDFPDLISSNKKTKISKKIMWG